MAWIGGRRLKILGTWALLGNPHG